MRLSGPGTQADHFERDGAIETFLMGAINYPLATAANFLEQLVVTKVAKSSCPPRDGLAVASRSRRLLFVRRCKAIIEAGAIRLRRGYGGQLDPGHRFILQ